MIVRHENGAASVVAQVWPSPISIIRCHATRAWGVISRIVQHPGPRFLGRLRGNAFVEVGGVYGLGPTICNMNCG